MVKAIIFDFDGTLVETAQIKSQAFKKVFSEYGRELSERFYMYHLQNQGVPREQKFIHFFEQIKKTPWSSEDIHELSAKFSRLIAGQIGPELVRKEVVGFLTKNKARLDFHIASAAPQEELTEFLRLLKLDQFFKNVYGTPVPKGAAVRQIIKAQELLPTEVVMVGDAYADLEAATEVPIKFLKVKDSTCPRLNKIAGLEIFHFDSWEGRS